MALMPMFHADGFNGVIASSLSTSLQRIPQYIEVPQNVEAKLIISYFFAIFSY
jgi:hypothetical protein